MMLIPLLLNLGFAGGTAVVVDPSIWTEATAASTSWSAKATNSTSWAENSAPSTTWTPK